MSRKNQNVTRRGVPFDLTAILMQNANSIAVGNIPVNARGDRIGPGGQVVTKAEDIAKDTLKHTVPSPPRSMSIKKKAPLEIEQEIADSYTEKKVVKTPVKKPKETILPNGDIIKGDE